MNSVFNRKEINYRLLNPNKFSEESRIYIGQKLIRHFKARIKVEFQTDNELVYSIINELTFDIWKIKNKKLDKFYKVEIVSFLKEMSEDSIDKESLNELFQKTEDSNIPNIRVSEFLQLSLSLRSHPLFKEEVQALKSNWVANQHLKTQGKKNAFAKINLDSIYVSNNSELSKNKSFSKSEKEGIQKSLDLALITNDHFELVEQINKDTKIKSAKDLASWSKDDWKKVLSKTKEQIPNEEKQEDYIKNVMNAVERSFPTAVLLGKVKSLDKKVIKSSLLKLSKLTDNNENLFSKGKINWEGVKKSERNEIEESLDILSKNATTYKYLGIQDILNKKVSTTQKANQISSRLAAIDSFYAANPDIEFSKADFIRKSNENINWATVPEELQPQIRSQLLSFQRVQHLALNADTALSLLENDYDSAYRIANSGLSNFMARTGLSLGEARQIFSQAQRQSAQTAHQYYSLLELEHNRHISLPVDNTISHGLTGYNISNDPCSTQESGSTSSLYDQVRNEFQDIDGYADLFGPQNFCQCDHCKSIFSPAAYFVDLMRFIQVNITNHSMHGYLDPPSDSNGGNGMLYTFRYPCNKEEVNYPLWLKNRRPDLWNLEISCDCTYKMVPYLEIVNDILISYIKKIWIDERRFTDTEANTTDVFEEIFDDSNNHINFYAPISKAHKEMLLLLEYFDVSHYEILKAKRALPNLQNYAYLEVLYSEIVHTTSPYKLFGNRSQFTRLKVSEFLKYTKLNRLELDHVLNTNYIQANSSIIIEKEEFDEGIQYYDEELIDIDSRALNYLVHFIRLYKKLPWSIQEFDLVLDFISPTHGTSPVNSQQRKDIVDILKIQEITQLSLEEVIGVVYQIPNKSLNQVERIDELTGELYSESLPGYLDRNYNTDKIFRGNTTIDLDPVSDEESLAYFSSGLKLSLDEIEDLRNWTWPDGSSILNSNGIDISEMSKYFRHSRLSKAFNYSLEEWYIILKFKGDQFDNVETIRIFLEDLESINKGSFSIRELQLLLQPTNDSHLVDLEVLLGILHDSEAKPITKQLLKEYSDLDQSQADDLFEQMILDGILTQTDNEREYITTKEYDWTKLQSSVDPSLWSVNADALKDFFNQNHSISAVAGQFFTKEELGQLADLSNSEINNLISLLESSGFIVSNNNSICYRVLEALTRSAYENQLDLLPTSTDEERLIRESLSIKKDAVYKFLTARHPHTKYAELIMSMTGIQSSEIIMGLSPNLENNFLTQLYTKLSNDIIDGLPVGFIDLAHELERWTTFLNKLNFTVQNLSFLNNYHSSVFKITNVNTNGFFNFDNIKKIEDYITWVKMDVNAVEEILHPMLLNIRSDEDCLDTIAALSHYYSLSETTVLDVFPNYSSSYTAHSSLNRIEFADYIKTRATLCDKLGLKAQQLDALSQTSYTNMMASKDLLEAKMRSEFDDPEDFLNAYEPIEKKINEIERDILCDYILARTEVKFEDKNELYSYFLLDPQMSGCMKISKIVAAHLSLQLYVHRVQLNLEQNQVLVNGSLETNFKAFLDPDVKEEWEWRKNYRVWEANRKVAVYPENFIEPEWRDNKSPEFEQLEEELLQQKISMESAEIAYFEYLKKLDTLSILVIGGACMKKERGIPIYYIFGRDHNQPFQYYWRKIKVFEGENLSNNLPSKKDYSSWDKVEIPIDSNFISPYIYQNKVYIFWLSVIAEEKAGFTEGTSDTSTYHYRYTLNYSYLNIKGKWVQPQKIEGISNEFESFFNDDLDKFRSFKKGKTYNRIYPIEINDSLYVSIIYDNGENYSGHANNHGRNFKVDFYNQKLEIEYGLQDPYSNDYYFDISLDDAPQGRLSIAKCTFENANLENALGINGNTLDKITHHNIAPGFIDLDANTDLRIVHMHQYDSILKYRDQHFLIRNISQGIALFFESTRLSSSIFQELTIKAFKGGIKQFLTLKSQYLPEYYIENLTDQFPSWRYIIESDQTLNFSGSFGLYFRELFFHIPFIIADHLNAEGKYKEADWWYRKIFDPSAKMDDYVINPVDRNWQYVEFRNQSFPKYSEQLTDGILIENYKSDPFNPHVIARFRSDSYPKAIILKYIDNLLDWGDSLFRKFQFESINEAMMLYVLAQDILGERPLELGKCETGSDDQLTYADVESSLNDGTDFIIWLENMQIVGSDPIEIPEPIEQEPEDFPVASDTSMARISPYQYNERQIEIAEPISYSPALNYMSGLGAMASVQSDATRKLLFCVPMNNEILGLWDRVEDRLFKIRHCMNIQGIKQTLSLFAPPIDPRLLVAARASGLSIADAIASLDAPVPNYRFSYMLEKAKSFASTVQSFGSGLLSAMEKKDGEALTLLRSVHEQNILKLTKDIKKNSIEESKAQLQNLKESKKNIENRIQYYTELIDTGLISWEKTQQISTHTASIIYGIESTIETLTSTLSLIPNVGSPFSMNYGGVQLKGGMAHAAKALNSAAKTANLIASSAGLEASNQRREQEWKNQLKLSEQELKAMEKQILAAEIRLAIAEKDLEVHENQIEQAKELYDFYKEKFSNLGLYKYMATSLNRLFSQAYNLAFDMAKQAEKCYQFETDDLSYFIENDNWDSGYAGLLAGERLTLQLQQMEKSYLEKTPRREEITQSFSLRSLSPDQLVSLRNNGSCNFILPEWAFDIYYPGHYRRIIKTVRITIPCVAGPYTNVSCRLTMTQNKIRTKPISGDDYLFAGPNSANDSISTSTANNDGGQFELNFNDPRYLPFEGGGAVESNWTLDLPQNYRSFDYNSISDAIIHISYTALFDNTLKSQIDTEIGEALNSLNGQEFTRLISLKEEFPDDLYQLEQLGSAYISLNLESHHFPYIFNLHQLNITSIEFFNDTDSSFNSSTVDPTNPFEVDVDHSRILGDGDVIILVKFEIDS